MQTILGPFHPYLEDALVREIRNYKKYAPLCPLLILVPSDSLRRRLKILLAGQCRLNLLNLHILTFYQLSLRLWEERGGASELVLQDNSFLEEMLRQMIRKRVPGTEIFVGLEETVGGSAALWQTLRDLKDGAVDPSVAREAAKGGLFGEEVSDQVDELLALFAAFLSGCERWNIKDYADLDLMALEKASSSAYLKQFAHIFYYGFYDLTQIQLDLFQAVARRYPTTLFFPLLRGGSRHPAWTFAERFYERYVHGLTGRSQTEVLPAGSARKDSALALSLLPLFAEEGDKRNGFKLDPITIFSCFSSRDEVDAVAKEILRLVSDEKFSFEQIGVVGRTLEPYLPWIKEIFSQHCIPMTTSAEEQLVQRPLAKAALLFINLPLRGYLRSHVIDLLDSPFFNGASSAPQRTVPRPDLWDFATRRLGISKGLEEWRRLEKYFGRDIVSAEETDEDSEPKKITVPADQIEALWHLFTGLYGDLETLPKKASWSRFAEVWRGLQKKWLRMDQIQSSSGDETAELIEGILDRLSALDAVNETVSLSHFIETYQHWLERASVPATEPNERGIAVLDAMAARGIPFRALFIIGLNEGLFPRTIREDAFLRDRERELLETVLGYKVATKLGGFDEERLLFTLLVGAAKEKLYCLYPRNDDAGRSLAPSWYLDELYRALDGAKIKKIVVPRGAVEKSVVEPFNRSPLVPPQELAIRLVLASRDAAPLVKLCLPAPSLYTRGIEVTRRLETITDILGERDGVIGPVADYWKRVAEEGLSPTSLEVYARCPFQFFARNLLGLERLQRPEEVAGPGAADEGQIVHSILRSFYQELIDRKCFLPDKNPLNTHSTSPGQSRAILKAVTQKVFLEFERDNPVGYPLAWEIRKEIAAELLEDIVARDLQELDASGYVPWALECDAAVRLPENWPSPLSGLTIRGRMDRIDYHPAENRYRVVDYKLKSAKSRESADKDLFRSALRGLRLQLPFYLLLGKEKVKAFQGAEGPVDAAFYFLAPRWPEGPLIVESLRGDAWAGPSSAGLKETMAFLTESIRQGFFFVQPDDYCRYCEVSEACRRNHRPTMWRVERDLRCKAHLDLKDKKVEPR